MDSNFSLADVASVVGNRSSESGFLGGYGGILALIIIFVLLFGNGGWGNNGNNSTNMQAGMYATQADIQRGFDNSAAVSKLDGISNGICDATFALNNAITNGFANSALANVQGFNGVNQGINTLGYQMQQCCCETNRNIDAMRYEAAKNTCDVIQANNMNTQRIIDTMTANTIQELRDQVQTYQSALNNNAQTTTLINALRPVPTPAYITCSPYQAQNLMNILGSGCSCA